MLRYVVAVCMCVCVCACCGEVGEIYSFVCSIDGFMLRSVSSSPSRYTDGEKRVNATPRRSKRGRNLQLYSAPNSCSESTQKIRESFSTTNGRTRKRKILITFPLSLDRLLLTHELSNTNMNLRHLLLSPLKKKRRNRSLFNRRARVLCARPLCVNYAGVHMCLCIDSRTGRLLSG